MELEEIGDSVKSESINIIPQCPADYTSEGNKLNFMFRIQSPIEKDESDKSDYRQKIGQDWESAQRTSH